MSVLVDIGLSFGFSLLSSFLKPRKVNSSPDTQPTVNFGESLYRLWGTATIPGTFMFAGEPSLNNPVQLDGKTWSNPEEVASYAVFLHTNPTSSAALLAVKVNGLIVASGHPALPLTKEIKTTPVTDPGTGLKKYQQVTYRFYNGSQTAADPMIIKNGYDYLVYQNQSYLVIADSLRTVYGGRGATTNFVIADSITTTQVAATAYKGFGDAPCTIEYYENAAVIPGVFVGVNKTKVVVPRGYQFAYSIARFQEASSILGNNALAYLCVFGTESEFLVTDNINTLVSGFTVAESGYNVSPPGVAGKYNRLVYPSSVLPTVNTNKVVVGKQGGELRTVTLTSPTNGPFYGSGTTIFNAVGTAVGTMLVGETVFGWNDTIYIRNSITNNTTPLNDPPLGLTNLQTVMQGLLEGTGLNAIYASGFNTNLIGFTTNKKERTTDISNLLAVFNRIVYQKRDGTLVFAPYPSLPGSPIAVRKDDHVEYPEIKIEPYESFPDGIEFTYKDLDREFTNSVVRVGGDTGKIDNFAIDLVCTRSQALVYANNLFNRTKRQILSGTLTLPPEYNAIEPGDVLLLEKLNPSGEDLYIIILRVETGANLVVKAEFINYAPINDTPTVVANNAGVSSPASGRPNLTYVVDTEARSPLVGLGYFTTSSGQIKRGGDLSPAVVTNLSGTVNAITTTTIEVNTTSAPLVNNEYYLLNTSTGDGSWITPSVVTITGNNTYTMTITQGKYGSNTFTSPTNLIILQILEESVINDAYYTNTLIQDGVTYTHSFTTRKRLVQPRPTGVFVTANNVIVYRASNFLQQQDLNLSLGTFPLTYWKIQNTVTGVVAVVGSSSATIEYTDFTFIPGQSVIITEIDSGGVAVTGGYATTFTL